MPLQKVGVERPKCPSGRLHAFAKVEINVNAPIAGSSLDTAIVIIAPDSFEGVQQENAWLNERFGRRGFDWVKSGQMLIKSGGRAFDRIDVDTPEGPCSVYFDISSFLRR